MRVIFDATDPLVVNGTYDIYGYTPKERRALERRQKGSDMAKRGGKRPKQQDLIEDRAIKALDNVAGEYADIRDQRIALNQQEAELKKKTMRLMKEHKKREYKHDGIEIRIVEGEEDIKVRVKKETEDEDNELETNGGAGAEA